MKQVEVVAAVIKHNDKILCVQKGENKLPYISKKFEIGRAHVWTPVTL